MALKPPARVAPAKPVAPAPAGPRSALAPGAYDRYGLLGNPFRDLASESLQDVELYHVNVAGDESLASIREEVYARENKAVVAVVGNQGAGKTERLLLAATEGRQRGAFVVYHDLQEKVEWVLPSLAQRLVDSVQLGGFARIFSAPAWFRDLLPLTKPPRTAYDPLRAGKTLAAALNAKTPSFLLLNDLHNLAKAREADPFAKLLQQLFDSIRPGVLVMFGSFPGYYVELSKLHPPLASRINRTILLPTLSRDEAALLIAKKLLAKRLVENLDPLYPFDKEAVEAINSAAYGNPRRLLELADRAIEYGVSHRTYRIDADLIRNSVLPPAVPASPPVAPPGSTASPTFPSGRPTPGFGVANGPVARQTP